MSCFDAIRNDPVKTPTPGTDSTVARIELNRLTHGFDARHGEKAERDDVLPARSRRRGTMVSS